MTCVRLRRQDDGRAGRRTAPCAPRHDGPARSAIRAGPDEFGPSARSEPACPTEPIETTNLDTIYGSQTIPWSRPRDLLAVGALSPEAHFFLGTVRPDGRPHAAGISAAWYDGDLYFQCGPDTRKARNIAANPACTISGSLPSMDLVFEGEARRVADAPTLEAIAVLYREGGWPVQVDGDAFTAPYSAPSAGPLPWHHFRLTAHTVFGVAGAEPHGATRWRF